MSRGLSKYQKAVVEQIKLRGALNIFDVYEIVSQLKLKSIVPLSEYPDALMVKTTLIEVGRIYSIENVSSLYRMMQSLEKRGLVARVLNTRPCEWLNVYGWDGNDPIINLHDIEGWTKIVLIEKGSITLRFKREKMVTLPKESYLTLLKNKIFLLKIS